MWRASMTKVKYNKSHSQREEEEEDTFSTIERIVKQHTDLFGKNRI